MVSRIVSPCSLAQPGDLLPHVGAHLGVEAGGGLVEEQHVGPVDERHGDVEAALHAAGVAARDAIRRVGEAEALEQTAGAPLELAAAQAVDLPLEAQVLAAGGLAVDARALRHGADAVAHPVGVRAHVEAGHARLARIRLGERGQDLHRRGLAGSVRAEQTEDRALLDCEAELVEGAHVAGIGLHEVVYLYGVGHYVFTWVGGTG